MSQLSQRGAQPGPEAAVLGALLADALGVPHEFKSADTIPAARDLVLVMPPHYHKTYAGIPYGTWSDDGSQLLCLLASLQATRGELDPGDFACRMLAWWRSNYMQAGGLVFDIGGQTVKALSRLRTGASPLDSGACDVRGNGNGSLMRCLPVGLAPALWDASLEATVAMAMTQSRMTHGHLLSQVTCALYTLLAATVHAPPDSWREAAFSALSVLDGMLSTTAGAQEALASLRAQADQLPQGSGYVLDTFWSTIWALDQGTGYLSAVRYAISLGNDTDTTACVTGGLAGLVYGIDVPADWWASFKMPAEALQALEQLR